MRIATKDTEVFTYDELSDSAKERVQEMFGQWGWEDGQMQESMQMIADGILEDAGFSPAEHLSYSLYSPGGDPRFQSQGKFDFEGQDYDLYISTRSLGGNAEAFELDLYVDGEAPEEYPDGLYAAAKEFIWGLSGKMLKAFYAEDDYIQSDESVREMATANEYEFTAEGALY